MSYSYIFFLEIFVKHILYLWYFICQTFF